MLVAKRNGSDTTNLSKSPPMLDQCGYPANTFANTFVKHLFNSGPTSPTLFQHCTSVIGLQMFCVCWVGDVIMVIPWFMSIRHRNFLFLIKKCSMLMVKPSAFDVSEQSYGKFGRIYSLNYLQNNSQNYGI